MHSGSEASAKTGGQEGVDLGVCKKEAGFGHVASKKPVASKGRWQVHKSRVQRRVRARCHLFGND